MATIYFDMANTNMVTGQGNFAVKVKGKKTQYFTDMKTMHLMLDIMGVESVQYGGSLEKLENVA